MTMPTIEQRKAELQRKAAMPSQREARRAVHRDVAGCFSVLILAALIAALAVHAGLIR